ncbi:MAG TPA: amidohydrolase family protein, partial [Gemmatimonadota bacterium]|nr:amidohydrolase family protein [Gemmatimonadota bacterium]
DGLFPADEHAARGGRLAVGSDGNVRIDAAEELRTLEFGQRLRTERRARLATEEGLGAPLWTLVAAGGAAALGARVGALEPGAFADLVVLDEDRPTWAGQGPARMLDALVVGGSRADLGDVYVGGRRVASGGRAAGGEEAAAGFRRVVARLAADLG